MEKINHSTGDKLSTQNILMDLTKSIKNVKIAPQDASVGNFRDYISKKPSATSIKRSTNTGDYTRKNVIKTKTESKPVDKKTSSDRPKQSDSKKDTPYVEKEKGQQTNDTQEANNIKDKEVEDVKTQNIKDKEKVQDTPMEKEDKKDISEEIKSYISAINAMISSEVKDVDLQEMQNAIQTISPEKIQQAIDELNLTDDINKALDKLVDLMKSQGITLVDGKNTELIYKDTIKQLLSIQEELLPSIDEIGTTGKELAKAFEMLQEPEEADVDLVKELQILKNDSSNESMLNLSEKFSGQANQLQNTNVFNQNADVDTVDNVFMDAKPLMFADKVVAESKIQGVNVTEQIQNFSKIVDEIRIAFLSNKTTINLKLEPESLGKLSVKINSENGVLSASFFVESEKTKQVLESQMSILRQSLTDQGVVVQDINVQVGQNNEDLQFHKNVMESKNYSKKLGAIATVGQEQDFNPYMKQDDMFNDLI